MFILSFCILQSNVWANETLIHKNPETGLLTWKSEGDGFTIELIQLVPDYIRAVYSKYDFTSEEIERVASFCNFGTIIQNTSQQALIYDVSDWRYVDKKGNVHPVKTKSQWLEEWKKAGITFSWTLLPDSEDFGVGDWQQGFTTIKIASDKKFDFIFTWVIEGKKYQRTIEDMSCAPKTQTKK